MSGVTTAEEQHSNRWLEYAGAAVATIVMGVYAFTVVAPYALAVYHPEVNSAILDVIKSNKSTVDLITTAVVMFYFGASVGRRKDQETLGTLVDTTAAAQKALAPVLGMETDTEIIPVAPGEEKKIIGTS